MLLRYLLVNEIERTARGRRYRYRLCGTEVEEHFGIALRGQYIDTMMQGSYRAYIESLYNRLVDQRRPIYPVNTYKQRLTHTKRPEARRVRNEGVRSLKPRGSPF